MGDELRQGGRGGSKITVSPSTKPLAVRKKNKATQGSTFTLVPGQRNVKGYPLTERDMRDLLAVGKESSRLFAIGGATGGFAINTAKDLVLNNYGPDVNLGLWQGAALTLAAVSIVCFILGWLKRFSGKSRVDEIMTETSHDY